MKLNRYVNRQRQGFSLLEMIVSASLMAAILVPSLSVMRDAMAKSRALHNRRELSGCAVKVLEDECATVAGVWANGTSSGSFASEGHSNIRYEMTKSDAILDGGTPNLLMHIQVEVYYDEDLDSTRDTDEMQVSYRTKVANLSAYQYAE